jgi:hypothetical protein
MTKDVPITSDRINATMTDVMWREEHFVMKMAVFWVFVPCSLVGVYRHFSALMMEAASSSEMSVNFS